MTYYGPEWIKSSHDFLMSIRDDPNNNQFSEWLYGEWDESKYNTYKALNLVPVVSDYMDYLLDRRADSEYMRRNQMTYSDIHDPRKLKQTSSYQRAVSSAINFVSKNVTRLYG